MRLRLIAMMGRCLFGPRLPPMKLLAGFIPLLHYLVEYIASAHSLMVVVVAVAVGQSGHVIVLEIGNTLLLLLRHRFQGRSLHCPHGLISHSSWSFFVHVKFVIRERKLGLEFSCVRIVKDIVVSTVLIGPLHWDRIILSGLRHVG